VRRVARSLYTGMTTDNFMVEKNTRSNVDGGLVSGERHQNPLLWRVFLHLAKHDWPKKTISMKV